MPIRDMTFKDLRQIANVMEEMALSSHYGDRMASSINRSILRDVLATIIARSWAGTAKALVYEDDKGIGGIAVAMVSPAYEATAVPLVTMPVWWTSARVPAVSTVAMAKKMVSWAKEELGGKGIFRVGVTDAFGSPDAPRKALEMLGFRQTGYVMEQEV